LLVLIAKAKKVQNRKNLFLLLKKRKKKRKRDRRRKRNRKEKKIIMKILKSQKENKEKGDIERKW